MSSNPPTGAPSAPNRPNNGPMIVKRKKPAGDPFFAGPKIRGLPKKPVVNGQPGLKPNGNTARPVAPSQTNALGSSKLPPGTFGAASSSDDASVFSDPQLTSGKVPYTDYKLVTTKKDLIDGLRFHILQLAGDKAVDIRNDSEFPKPARLHRRDPYAIPPSEQKEDIIEPRDGMNAAEREELNKRKEIRQKEREANLAQIAPSQSTNRKVPHFKKRIQQVFRSELTDEDKRRIQTNYEEKLPWHLEDFDNKNCFIGEHKLGSTSTHVAFVPETGPGGTVARFRMIPVEKLYQFKLKPTFKTMNIEEAEAAMNKKEHRLPAWQESILMKKAMAHEQERMSREAKGLYTGAQQSRIAGRQGEEADLDYDEDFADDEEGADLFDVKDEDEALAAKKIKEDLLKANVFGMKLAQEYDAEEEEERKEAASRKAGSKRIRKALERRERNFNHGSDTDGETSTDSEEERERERLEMEKRKNEKKEEETEEGKKSGLPSGTNTPSGRKEKQAGAGTASDREGGLKKGSSSARKRPGSPNLSDASGTDTSTTRKKFKSRHLSSSQPALGNISRSRSPSTLPSSTAPSALVRARMRAAGSAAGSDTEMGNTSDAAMSEGERARRQQQRLRLQAPSNAASRSASPAPPGQSISRPSSTAPPGASSPPGSQQPQFPTVDEIRAMINQPGGITPADLLNSVNLPTKAQRQQLAKLIQQIAKLGKNEKKGLLIMKE